jgi:Fe-S cluster biosynthesis and repair protein YggX
MARIVKCVKLGIEAEGLDAPPFPGLNGQRIFENVSKQVWREWLAMQTMIINERRLASFDPAAKKILEAERDKFLFSGGFEMPNGFVPQKPTE